MYNAQLQNDDFIGDDDKEKGVMIWAEASEGTNADYAQVERVLNRNGSLSDAIVSVMNLSVFKKVGSDESAAIKITESDTAIEIAFDLSGNEKAQRLASIGRLGLFSIHEGVAQGTISGTYDRYTKIYTVRLRKFSTYAFIEAENEVIDSTPSAGDNTPMPTYRNVYNLPKTGIE